MDLPYLRIQHPVSAAKLRKAGKSCRVVQWDAPLSDEDHKKVARFLAAHDLTPLLKAPALEALRVTRMPHLSPTGFAFLTSPPKLKALDVFYASAKKARQVRELSGLPSLKDAGIRSNLREPENT